MTESICVVCGDPTEGDVVCSAECNDVNQKDDGGQCPVCGSWVDIGGCCSKSCYDLWTAPADDERWA